MLSDTSTFPAGLQVADRVRNIDYVMVDVIVFAYYLLFRTVCLFLAGTGKCYVFVNADNKRAKGKGLEYVRGAVSRSACRGAKLHT